MVDECCSCFKVRTLRFEYIRVTSEVWSPFIFLATKHKSRCDPQSTWILHAESWLVMRSNQTIVVLNGLRPKTRSVALLLLDAQKIKKKSMKNKWHQLHCPSGSTNRWSCFQGLSSRNASVVRGLVRASYAASYQKIGLVQKNLRFPRSK